MSRLEEVLGEGYDPFSKSWRTQSAVIRELEMIGEATGAVSLGVRGRHPEIRWSDMRGFSSFAKHQYWRVDTVRVWKALEEMPKLRDLLSKVKVPLDR